MRIPARLARHTHRALVLALTLACCSCYEEDGEPKQCVKTETCNGEDDDCDGWVDAYHVGSELLSACVCDRRVLQVPKLDNGSNNTTTTCSVDEGVLSLETTMQPGEYAACVSDLLDWMAFDVALGGKTLLEVSFQVESAAPLQAAVNLWYEGTTQVAGGSARKYVPLLRPEDAPGTYVRRFAPDSVCFPSGLDEIYGCRGQRAQPACAGCAANDSCGAANDACSVIDFSRVRLQLVVEYPSVETVAASLRIEEIALVSLGCLSEGDP